MQCTSNVYGSDEVEREDWGVEKTPPKSGSLFALHTQALLYKYRKKDKKDQGVVVFGKMIIKFTWAYCTVVWSEIHTNRPLIDR